MRTVQPVLLELDREMEQAARSLGASPATIFRRIILPNLLPAIVAGTALAFARAISEFGSTVLISGNIPFKTQVAAVHIFSQIESDNSTGAAAVATVLLVVALVCSWPSTCSSGGGRVVAKYRRPGRPALRGSPCST